MEMKFTLNPFKNLTRNPVLYVILDKKSQKIMHKVFCVNKKEKNKFKELLEEFGKRGKIKLKKHKNWFQNFKGYSKYTKLNGENIPIIEYEFSKSNNKT
jgi:hypothetical protein